MTTKTAMPSHNVIDASLREQIESGNLRPGGPVPSYREL